MRSISPFFAPFSAWSFQLGAAVLSAASFLACGTQAELDAARGDSAEALTRELVVVAIGDSMASGEGNPYVAGRYDDLGRNPRPAETWGFPAALEDSMPNATECHRSNNAWTSRAAALASERFPGRRIRFVSFACSGAKLGGPGVMESYQGIEPSGAWIQPQIDQVNTWLRDNGLDHIDAMLVSAGANDAKFAEVLSACVIPGTNCTQTRFFPLLGGSIDRQMRAGLDGLAQSFADLRAVVQGGSRAHTNDTHRTEGGALQLDVTPDRIYVAEYPNATRDEKGAYCDNDAGLFWPPQELLWHVSGDESQYAETELIEPLNEAIVNAADRQYADGGNPFVAVTGIESAFTRHGFCAGTKRWFTTTQDARHVQGSDNAGGFASSGMLHPNAAGHAAIANLVVTDYLGPQIEGL